MAVIQKVRGFISEVVVELKKVSWSTRSEVIDSTKVVLLSSLLLGIFIGITDFILSRFLEFIIR